MSRVSIGFAIGILGVGFTSARSVVGQTVENHFVPALPNGSLTSLADWVDIPGSEKVVVIPPGSASIAWAFSCQGEVDIAVRPVIGSNAPTDGIKFYDHFNAGVWTATVPGGSTTVKLQVKDSILGNGGSVVTDPSHSLSWTLTVFATAASGVPAVGGVGLAILAVSLGVAAWSIARRASSQNSTTVG